jgi:uncharacterized protein YbgA (DUF1722 family)/uncharacterized protein YbbK (DUF523 family)
MVSFLKSQEMEGVAMEGEIRLGISRCLLGENVRFDGGHQRDRFLTDTLGNYVTYVPVCPEVECGLPVPREAMRLVGDSNSPRLVTIRSREDHTDRMQSWARGRLKELEGEGLCGFVFKAGSPSSGMERVKVYDANGVPAKKGRGVFAAAFMEHFPLIPVEEDGRLHDPGLRENFIERIFTLKRWRETLKRGATVGNLVDFHARHKLLSMSHSEKHTRRMGKLVAQAKSLPLAKLYAEYEGLLMESLSLKATVRKHTNVLQHMMGYFKKDLTGDEKQEMLEVLEEYRQEMIPLIVPVTLINHYVRKYGKEYLAQQAYLNPHPIALKLRNHA